MPDTIRYTVADQVATISLSRPHVHNAIDPSMSEDLVAAVRRSGDDPAVRVLVLLGEGPSFCSGVDMDTQGQRRNGEDHFAHLFRSGTLTATIASSVKPVIAGVHGYVLGKGLELALAADIRVAAANTRIGFPETRLGLVTDNGGSWRAAALAGPSRTKYLLMTAEPVTAEVALSWGLVDEIAEPDELTARVMELAQTIAQRPPLAVRAAKVLVDDAARGRSDMEVFAQVALLGTADYADARAARAAGRTSSNARG